MGTKRFRAAWCKPLKSYFQPIQSKTPIRLQLPTMFQQHNPNPQPQDRRNLNEQNLRQQILMAAHPKISALALANKPPQRHGDDPLPDIEESYFLQPKLGASFAKEIKTTNGQKHHR